jgi:hypothetical protein
MGWIIIGSIKGFPQSDIRLKLQHIEEPHGKEKFREEISPMRLHASLSPEMGIGGGEVIEDKVFEKRLGMGIKTDLRKYLNRLIITLFSQIVITRTFRQETVLIPVLASKEGGSKLP